MTLIPNFQTETQTYTIDCSALPNLNGVPIAMVVGKPKLLICLCDWANTAFSYYCGTCVNLC